MGADISYLQKKKKNNNKQVEPVQKKKKSDALNAELQLGKTSQLLIHSVVDDKNREQSQ